MCSSQSATRTALLSLAAILMGSVGVATLAYAENSPVNRAGPSPLRPMTVAVSEPERPSTVQKATTGASEPDSGASPASAEPEVNEIDVRELEKKPEAPEAPAAAAPVPQAPSDPLGAALFARLNGTAPLVARFPSKEREAMLAFYALGDFKPVWIKDGAYTPAANSVIARLRAAGEDGLDPSAYPVPTLPQNATDSDIAETELKFSAAAVLYARDARGGRINLANISKLVTPALDLPSSDAVLGRLAVAGDGAGNLLQSYNPQQAGYLALKSRLGSQGGDTPRTSGALKLPVGQVVTVGMRDPRVPQLREFFGLESRSAGTLDQGPGEPDLYDATVAEAITKFQASHDLPANGNLTRATIITLAIGNAPKAVPSGRADLVVNMERWRWLPADLGANYVMVNIPEYRLRVVKNGSLLDEARVIVGKVESPTPVFSGAMEYAVVNPSWFVPPSILKTMLASGRTGGFEVIRRGNTISLRQPPGERNALGFIKFMFPNQHAVYLHDTPSRGLFSASKRAFSHGCVRVDDPFRFAGAVLPDWTSERLRKLIGKGERTIRLAEKLPVHLAYFTAYVDDGGTYRTLPDLYGYDNRMRAALGFAPSRDVVASMPPEPKRSASVTGSGEPASAPARKLTPAQRKAASTERAPSAEPGAPATAGERAPTVRPAVPRAMRTEPVRQPTRQAEQRVRRAPAEQAFGEPGLWTPPPPPAQPRGWW